MTGTFPTRRWLYPVFILFISLAANAFAQQSPKQSAIAETHRAAAPQRQIPHPGSITTGALQGLVTDLEGTPLPGVQVRLSNPRVNSMKFVLTSGDGIFRILRVPPGIYQLSMTPPSSLAPQNTPVAIQSDVHLNTGEVLTVQIKLDVTRSYRSALSQSPGDISIPSSYQELSRRPDAEGAIVPAAEEQIPPDSNLYQTRPYRWVTGLPDFPNYHRYGASAEAPYVLGHWYDPFNRNRLKGDYPIVGQKTFFNFTGDSITAIDVRRLPVPSGQSTARPGSPQFFGRGGQFFLDQTFRFTFDLFHGDTTAFRPVDWRIRITPAANINYLAARENGVVNIDVRNGTTRTDEWLGLQEALAEVKLHDFGPNYDFMNLRAGIQAFTTDFRGFIFADEQPGVRLFGNLHSNRIQYNLAGFDLLEKNTNSGLNIFHRRSREVAVANLYLQDFFAKGYTTQFSYHFARDNATTHYDDNGFLVRPAPIGTFAPHRVDAQYFGWTCDGHIGILNIDNAFYQVLGNDTLNPLAGKPVRINAQLAALELSRDHDWLRYRISFLYASGDDNPRDGTARGFSSIVDGESFAGGEFSFFNREGIRLTSTGIALTAPDSFLPDLRSSKDEGQSNFVNPGLYLYNAGIDAKLTPSLKLVGNVSFLQFARTQPLIFLLQQNGIRRTIGVDSSLGFNYRPRLSDNIQIIGGLAVLAPGPGLRDIYTSQTLISAFETVRFQF